MEPSLETSKGYLAELVERFKKETWGKLTEIKIPHLHEQHCQLVGYLIEIFRLQETMKIRSLTESELRYLQKNVLDIQDFVLYHLREEEEFLERIAFPEVVQHKFSHARLTTKFTAIKQLLEADAERHISDLFLLIYSWLFEHINSMDTLYSQYYVQMPLAADFPSNEYLLDTIMMSAIDGVVIINDQGTILKFNAAAENLFEYDAAEVIGRNVSTLMPSPYREEHDGYVNRYLQTGEARIIGTIREVTGLRRNGQTFPLELSVSQFRGKNSTYFTGILHDITLRKKQEEEIIQARDHLEQMVQERTRELQEKIAANERANAELHLAAKVFENAGEAILITDPDGNILSVNRAYLEITGFDYADVIGQNPRIAKSDRHEPEFFAAMWNTLKTEGKWRGEIWDRRKDGNIYPKLLTITEVRNQDGVLKNYIGIFNDITDVKETEKKLENLAYYDSLTKLPNRKLFQVSLDHHVETARRSTLMLALLFIDLDKFKMINDTLGHGAGDDLLIQVASRLAQSIRKSDMVARLGGDEFTVILTQIANEESVAHLADNIIKVLTAPFILSGHEAAIGASIGISLFPQDGKNTETLIKHADLAMYQAKNAGRGVFRFFMPEMNALAQHMMRLETNLKKAVFKEEFTVYYQAKVDQGHHTIIGMEALVRWRHPEHGLIPPNEFIPMAEDTGLIIPIGLQVLRMACRDTAKLHQAGYGFLKVAVNLSVRQFRQASDLLQAIRTILAETGLPARALEMEITESMVMGNVEDAIRVMKQIRDLNVSMAMDDFGTGYSSLSHLKKLPLQTIKTDRSFIKDIAHSEEDQAIMGAIISMAKNLNLNVVAEGVETEAQLQFLAERGVHWIQGFYYSKPLPFDDFLQFVRAWPYGGGP
ncbi:MAG: EAL domain-containing protein [Magnetococcales bacterium]|nr:EAL domain-containing protein [Magnetococcales bacterium]